MITRNSHTFAVVIVLTAWSILLSSCTPRPTLTPTAAPSLPATVAPTHTSIPSVTQTLTATPVPFPVLTLRQGDFYFSTDEKQSVIFGRNIAGYEQRHYETLLDWTKAGRSKFVRIQLDNIGGMGFTHTGEVDLNWAAQWDRIIDKAEADGIYVLPVFSTWFDWNNGNPDMGYSTWKDNPMNQANGGFVKSPVE